MTYSVVVPVYNEELVVEESYRRIKSVMESCGGGYELIFVNDGSRDKTAEKLDGICSHDPCVRVIAFSRNFGHQPAITAGMDQSSGDAVIVIDADLQDPPEVIPAMIAKWREGFDVVYGKRLSRKGETFFKKATAAAFYRTLNFLTDTEIPVDTGDFRLIGRNVRDALSSLPERSRYVRGLVSWVGFKQSAVEYVREERFAGETKYPLKKMLRLAGDALISFSDKPLKLALWLGGLTAIAALVYILVNMIVQIITRDFSQYPYIIGALALSQASVLASLGIMGAYLGRIFGESKARPLYIIAEKKGFDC